MEALPTSIYFIFFAVAALYSTQGFGGGSSYLAALVLLGFSHRDIPPIALVCNLVVAGCAFWRFAQAGFFDWKKVFPFIGLSIPAAYVGGLIPLSREVFSLLLGIALLVVGLRILLPVRASRWNEVSVLKRWLIGLPVGGIIGLFSGMIGIGGGIFLSPFLILIRWADPKECAAAASLFIFVNSLAGLAGRLPHIHLRWQWMLPLAAAVALGGWLGSWTGAQRLPQHTMQKILAGLIFWAAGRLLGVV